MQPITLWGHGMGPNPWKVAVVLDELNIPYEHKFLEFSEMRVAPYDRICVNGRVPAIEDPNTGMVLWESGAIIEYLADTYDKDRVLSFDSVTEKYLIKQWIYFQTSGQGPYFGQAAWFYHFHPKDYPDAKERYKGIIKRVMEVLNLHLEGKEYLVGGKCSVADLSFITWNQMVQWVVGDKEFEELDISKVYPNYHAWNQRLLDRPGVKRNFEKKAAAKGHHEVK